MDDEPVDTVPSKKTTKAAAKSKRAETDSTVSDVPGKLDLILSTMTALQKDNQSLLARVAALEKGDKQIASTSAASTSAQNPKAAGSGSSPVTPHTTESTSSAASAPPATASTSASHEDFEDDFGKEEEEEEEDFDDFDAYIVSDKTSAAVDPVLAQRFGDGLLLPSDRARLREALESFPRPDNLPSLRSPVLNRELEQINQHYLNRDKRIKSIQDQVVGAISITSQVMSDLKTSNTLTRKETYDLLAHSARLLMASHKDLSQQRREAIRPALHRDYKILCNPKMNRTLTSNEYLFGDDVNKRAEEALKAKRLAQKYHYQAPKNGAQKGRFPAQGRPPFQPKGKSYSSHNVYPQQQGQQYHFQYNQNRKRAGKQTGFPPKFKKTE